MKHLPCILSFSAFLGLLLLGAAAVLGFPLTFDQNAPAIVGFSSAAGVLGFLMLDYAPSRSRPTVAARVVEPKRAFAPAAYQRLNPTPAELRFGDDITVNIMATLGTRSASATVSLS
jgi:hypothetical protein